MDIEWEEPPEYAKVIGAGSNPGRHTEFAVALRDHPGKWAVLPDAGCKTENSAMAKAQNIRRGKVKGFTPSGTYDAAVHGTKIWVRYKGKPGKPEAEPQPPSAKEQLPRQGQKAEPSVGEVRAWARRQGMEVPERGRLAQDVFEKYAEAVANGETGLGMRVVRD